MHRNIIYNAIQVAWRLILGNIFLLISNLVLVLLAFNLKFTLTTSWLYLICTLTVFPSLVALFEYFKNTEVGDKAILGAKIYFKYFKSSFKVACLSGLIYELILIFILIDIISANKLMKNGQFFLPTLMLLGILTIIHAMWNILVQGYFYVNVKEAFLFCLNLVFKRPMPSLLMIILIFGDYLCFKLFPQYAVLFIIPLTVYVLWKMTEKEFEDLKSKVVIKN